MAVRKQSGGHVQATLDAGDIQLGAVELKDSDSDVRQDVGLVTARNAAYTQSEDGGHVATGATTDAAASSVAAEDATARTSIGLWKGIKNILVLLNAKFVGGTVIGDVNVATITAGETHVGEIGYSKLPVIVTPTITGGAYTALDVIGAIQTLTDAARESGGTVTLDTLIIRDLAIQDADITIFFFNQNPSNGTYTDNIALDIHDTDMGFFVGAVRVLSSDYDDAADSSAATLKNVGLDMTAVGSANLYAIAQILVGDTYVGTSDLTFVYNFSRH